MSSHWIWVCPCPPELLQIITVRLLLSQCLYPSYFLSLVRWQTFVMNIFLLCSSFQMFFVAFSDRAKNKLKMMFHLNCSFLSAWMKDFRFCFFFKCYFYQNYVTFMCNIKKNRNKRHFHMTHKGTFLWYYFFSFALLILVAQWQRSDVSKETVTAYVTKLLLLVMWLTAEEPLYLI